jgi:hypothetical protein
MHTTKWLGNIVRSYEWISPGFRLDIGFIEHFITKLITTLNYSAIAHFHTLQFTRAHSLLLDVSW